MNFSRTIAVVSSVLAGLALAVALCACGPEAKPNLDPEGHKTEPAGPPVSFAKIEATPSSFSVTVVATLNKDTVLTDCKFIIDGVGEYPAVKEGLALSATIEKLDYETTYSAKAVAKKGGKEMYSSSVSFKTAKHPFNEVFWSYALNNYDMDKDGKLSRKEASAVTEILAPAEGFTSVYGMEFFQNLKSINFGVNSISEIDLSKNQNLTWIELNENPLKSLDISKNAKLMHVSAGGCGLTSLDVSKNTALKELHLQVNSIKSIDVSKLTGLSSFYISANDLSELDLSNNLSLTELHCHQNPNLKVLYLKQGQTIPNMSKDSWTEIRYK